MPTVTSDTVDTLEKVFQNVTGEGSPKSYFFQEIYVPILDRDPTTHAPSDPPTFTYKKVGMTTEELANAYWTLYGHNLLSVPLIPSYVDADMYQASQTELEKKMRSIFVLNKYKYLKWIDSMGYAYNPLWNVDGTDSFQYIDSHGQVTRTDNPYRISQEDLSTASYDSNSTNKPTSSTGYTYEGNGNFTETHADILPKNDNTINGPVHAITGGDYSHIEKRIRQGNIGVTQTSELIRNERELVRFNLIQEFFNDINKQLLVGVYPGF